MRCRVNFIPLLLAVTGVTAPALVQRPQPSLQPPAPPPAQTTSPISTLKANAQLVIVDVIVTGSKQNPVHNLKATDFTILDNGAPPAPAK